MVGLNDRFQELNPGCDYSLDNAVAAAKKIGEGQTARQFTL
jgi:hypothetical protein